MILRTAHITKFKCINDSHSFTLDPDVTCLVGKNEAGKTAILEALYRLKPVRDEKAKFDVVREYFKPEMLEYEKVHEANPETAVTTTWELEEDDLKALEAKIGTAARKIGAVTVARRFDNEVFVEFELDEADVIQGLIKASDIETKDRAKYKTAQTVPELLNQLSSTPEEQQQRNALIQSVKQKFGDKTATQTARDLIWSRVPRFAFFSQYRRMPGQLSVDDFKQRASAGKPSEPDEVFSSLLEMINMSVDGFMGLSTYEHLRARLEAARDTLTRELRSYWPDGKHLKMEFDFSDGLSGDPAPFNKGKIFRARILNERYGASTGFDERSSGFIWFFSFLVWFTQLQRNYKSDLVLLLDEPGMALHGTAQRELLRFIDQRLAKNYQVVYSTHSPFMIDGSNLHRARPVEDLFEEPREAEDPNTNPARGTKVFENWWHADRPTLFPLMGCVAFDLTQTMFISPHNLLVEGVADLIYIEWFRSKLAKERRPTLDKRWTVTPCGSISKIGAFLNLFAGNHLHCAVFCDYADGGKGDVRSLNETAVLSAAEVLTANEFAGKPQADMEDLLGDECYAALVNRCYDLSDSKAFVPPKASGNAPTGRIVKAAEEHMRTMPSTVPEFTHPGPADYLVRQGLDVQLPGLHAALDRFQALFERLNKILEEHLADASSRRPEIVVRPRRAPAPPNN
jgi:predicted ATP-dependent endonuclease of OLD family